MHAEATLGTTRPRVTASRTWTDLEPLERPPRGVSLVRAALANPSAWRAVGVITLLFLVVYGGTNAIVTSRGEFSTIGFDWERHIPFLWWMLVPYLSIEFLFLAAPFLCRSDDERRVLVQRITFSICTAAFFFLVIPLELSFPKRHATNWFDFALALVDSVDPPHNLFPSLHVALALVIGAHYVTWTRGWRRGAVVIWFVLIGVSTVLTHRHHVADFVGGAALGVAAVALFRVTPIQVLLGGAVEAGTLTPCSEPDCRVD